MLWSGWGDPERAVSLAPEVKELLRAVLGITRATPSVSFDEIGLGESRLSVAAQQRLAAVVGEAHVHTDRTTRILHTRGKSTPDLLRLRAGDAAAAPDAVIEPGSHDEVLKLLEVCDAESVAVVPYGGGTSVVGGLEPARGRLTAEVALDLRRLNWLLELDDISRTATLQAGMRAPDAERILAEHGFTLGHFPQSYEHASIGGFAATRSSGQASAGYGRFDERVVGLRIATPRGTLELGTAPKSAAGPDLRQLFLGSEGAFGVITAVKVEIAPAPEVRIYDGWRLDSFETGTELLRQLAQDGPTPTVLRLSDEAETALNLARPTALGANATGGCLAITGYEGSEDEVAAKRDRASELLVHHGGTLDRNAGEGWAQERFRGPYLRDALLDAGALAETLETATFWSNLGRLYKDVKAALTDKLTELGTPPVVLCHLSHVYRSGASLYFTVGAAQLDDPVAQWRAAKQSASDAIAAAGGSTTHHHGIGRDHKRHLAREIGPLAVDVLRAVKDVVDPGGVLNPGILIP
jgi:alkyldihydroxyacetonephosphate synthase